MICRFRHESEDVKPPCSLDFPPPPPHHLVLAVLSSELLCNSTGPQLFTDFLKSGTSINTHFHHIFPSEGLFRHPCVAIRHPNSRTLPAHFSSGSNFQFLGRERKKCPSHPVYLVQDPEHLKREN